MPSPFAVANFKYTNLMADLSGAIGKAAVCTAEGPGFGPWRVHSPFSQEIGDELSRIHVCMCIYALG